MDQPWVIRSEERSALARAQAAKRWDKQANELAYTPNPIPIPNPLPLQKRRSKSNPEKIGMIVGNLVPQLQSSHTPPAPKHRSFAEQLEQMIRGLESKPQLSQSEQQDLEALKAKRAQHLKGTV